MTRIALAKALQVSRETVRVLEKRGMPTDSVASAREWRRANLTNQEGSGDGPTTAEENRRLVSAKADLAELEAAEKAGSLCDTEDAQIAANEALVMVRTQVEAIPGRTAATLATMTDPAEIRAYLLNEVRTALGGAAARLEDWARMVERGAASQAAAKPDGGSVGGSVPDSAGGES